MQSFIPDIIFLEIQLPSESGLDLSRQIKMDHPDIVVVLLTSYDLPEYQAAAKKSGVEHLVPKDAWTGEDMMSLVQSILADRNIGDQGLRVRHQQTRHSS